LLCFCVFAASVNAQKNRPLSEEQQLKFDIAFVNGNKEKILVNYDDAIKQFAFCYGLNPQNAALNFVLGDTYFQKKQYESAEKYTLVAIRLEPTNVWYKELLVDIYIGLKKNKEAANLLTIVGREKKEVDYLLKSAYLYTLIKDYGNAIKVLEEVEKNIGINEDIVIRKEQIYLAQNKLDKAIKEVKKLNGAYPANLKYKGMLADLYWANGKTTEAIVIYKSILLENPTNGFALFALADYHKSIKEYSTWFDYLKRGMASSDIDAKTKVSVLSMFMGGKEFEDQSDKMLSLARVFVQGNSNEPLPYMVLGDLYGQQRKFDSARIEYRKALAIEPGTYLAWQQTIYCSSQLINNTFLLLDCEDALIYFPNEAAFYAYGAIAAAQLKQYDKSIDLAKRGIAIATSEEEDIVAQLSSSLGDAYHYVKNYAASDSVYESLIQKDSNNAYALNNYAYFLSLRKTQLEKAATLSKKSLLIDSGNPSYMDTYGWILYVQGEYILAKEYVEKSLSVSPNNAEVLDHLGDILYKLNNKEGALLNWKKAKELGNTSAVLDKKIKEGKMYE
jgi:tetratricopeptide (TPR) repeat protein